MLTPAVIVFFIGSYMTAIFGTPDSFQPIWWLIGYIIFVGLNVRGVALSFTVTVIVTLLALGILIFFFVSAIPFMEFSKCAMNIGVDPTTGAAVELPDGHGPFLPFGIHGVLAAMPFAVWLFLAIEELAAGVGRIGRSEARHAQGHHAWHVHSDRDRASWS